ncbi:MAG: hypothetical protein WBG50_10185 [Desulfomonilaceae bacterium]
MVNRMVVVIFFLSTLLLINVPGDNVAADPAQPGRFDLDACYARCPCNRNGITDWACSSCKTRCEWHSWRQSKEQAAKKGN